MITEGFLANDCNVLISSRDEATLEASAAELNELAAAAGSSGVCTPIKGDLSSRAGCDGLAEDVASRVSSLHVLVNNSGTSWGEPLDRKSGRMNWGFDKVFDLNVKSVFYLTRALLPLLDAAATPDDPARVINGNSVVPACACTITTITHQHSPTPPSWCLLRCPHQLVQWWA